jgi:hypothetical protein
VNREGIGAGVAGFVKNLKSIVNFVKVLLEVSVVDSFQSHLLHIQSRSTSESCTHGANPPDRRSSEKASKRNGSVMADITPPKDVETTEPKTMEGQSAEANQPTPVERLDKEVEKTDNRAFSGGPHCEVFKGKWTGEKGREENSGEVSVNVGTYILLTIARFSWR